MNNLKNKKQLKSQKPVRLRTLLYLIPKNLPLKYVAILSLFFLIVSVGCTNKNPADPLTKQERAWLSEHNGKIRLAYDPNARPVDFLDKEGRFQGLAADYVHLIEKRLGFTFDILHIRTWDEAVQKAKNREVDVLCTFTKNQEREQWMLFTDPYIIIPTVILTREDFKESLTPDTMTGMKVTFTKGWITDDYLRQNHGNLIFLPAIDADAAMNNLITYKADAWVTALTVASTKIEEHKVANIRVAGKIELSFRLAMASRKDWPVLNSILKKGLSLISEEERTGIFNKWIHIKEQSPFDSKTFRISLFAVICLTILPLLIIFSWNKALQRKVKEKTEALEAELAERKQAQAALGNSEDRYRSLVENQTDLISRFRTEPLFM